MLDDRDIDRLLAGRPVADADDLADLLAGTRAAYGRDPDPQLRERVLANMASQAPAAGRTAPTRQRRRMLPTRMALRVGATAGAFVLGTAGLAVAGVNLPDPASAAFDRVGVTLPNQADGGSADRGRSEEVRSVIDSTQPAERGCAFGHRVAEAARGEALPEQARGACERGDEGRSRGEERSAEGRARAEQNGNGAGDSAGREFGRETSDRAQQQRTATPEARRQFGQETSGRAREHARSQGGSPPAAPGPDAGAPQGQAGPPEGAPGARPESIHGPPEGVPGGRP